MAKKKPNKKKLKLRKSLERQVLKVFKGHSRKPMNHKQVASALGYHDQTGKLLVNDVMMDLGRRGLLDKVDQGRYKLKGPAVVLEGRIQVTRHGSAYVITDSTEEDIYIQRKNVGRAFDGDRVKISLFTGKKKPEGQVLEIVKRGRSQYTGIIHGSKHNAFFVPDSGKMHKDIYIPKANMNGAQPGEKVIVEITDWPIDSFPHGNVVEVLGAPGENEVEMNAILAEYGFPLRFPKDVEEEAKNISTEITEAEIAKRTDYREVLTFTIDPDDAKDFDDALSFKDLGENRYEIGVHIADVTHYVKPGSKIEKEAVERATSVYLVDRVIPMLPEVLSNQVCSLRPQEEKLTYSVLFEMNDKAEVLNHRLEKTVIFSDRRFTYNEVQDILEKGEGELHHELSTINRLAKTLREKRMKSGAIAFEKTEVKFKLDKKGMPAEILFKVQKDAHKLIEEFMLLANRTVSQRIGRKTKDKDQVKTFVYRVHDQPDPTKVANFIEFIKQFGYKLKQAKGGNISQSLNELLEEVKNKPEQNVVETLAIRAMAKAEYTTQNIGHYGLSFAYYSHFTSPIRRYPDMIAHRLLFQYANGQPSANEDEVEEKCKHSSLMERKAAEAERDSTKFFQMIYMQDSEGLEFDGYVSGATSWGLYVEIADNKCEGMVGLKDLSDDYYYFDDSKYAVVGHNTGTTIKLGDPVRIRVKHVDIPNKRMDFELVSVTAGEDALHVID